MENSAVNFRIAAAALFVREGSGIADAREHQPMLDLRHDIFVAAEPRDRANRARDEEKSIGIAMLHAGKSLREVRGNGQAGEIVVTKGWMAGVAGNKDLFFRRARNKAFGIREATAFERRIDHHLICVFRERIQLALTEAKAPSFAVIRSAVRNPVRP